MNRRQAYIDQFKCPDTAFDFMLDFGVKVHASKEERHSIIHDKLVQLIEEANEKISW